MAVKNLGECGLQDILPQFFKINYSENKNGKLKGHGDEGTGNNIQDIQYHY